MKGQVSHITYKVIISKDSNDNWRKVRMKPVKAVVKSMTVSRNVTEVYNYFKNMKNLEVGGQITSLQKSNDDDWWTFDHAVAGKSKIKLVNSIEKYGMLDHQFVGGGLTWDVYVRVVPNKEGSTTTWIFVKPDGLTDIQFEEQLKNYDSEIEKWKSALESIST